MEGEGEQNIRNLVIFSPFLSSTVWKCRTLAGFVGYGQSMHCKASCCLLRWLHLHKISLFFLTWWWNDFSVNQITHSSKSLITLHVTKKIMVSIHQSVREGGSKNKWAVVCTLPSFRHSKAPKFCIPMRESGTCIMCRCDWLFTCLLCTNLSSIYILNTILQSKLPAFNIGALAVTVILSLCSSC